jgi:mRNA interferase HigB
MECRRREADIEGSRPLGRSTTPGGPSRGCAQWKTPQEVKKAHPKASILKGGRLVFNIKANDYRLIVVVQYDNGVMVIRFFAHEEYDKVDAEAV